MVAVPILEAFERLRAAVTEFVEAARAGEFSTLDNGQFVSIVGEFEVLRRLVDTVDYPIVEEVGVRDLPNEQWLKKNPAGFLGHAWQLTPGEANSRVREAAALAPRPQLSGERLPARYPIVAEARATGQLARSQAAAVVHALNALPDTVPAERFEGYERVLVEAARSCDATLLRRIGRHMEARENPDGRPPVDDTDDPRRGLSLTELDNGMGRLVADLTPETLSLAQALIVGRAAPRPTDETGRDTRTPTQRRHDAFLDLLGIGLRSGELATATGASVQLIVTMTADQLETKTGLATVSTGQRIRIDTALLLADESCIAWVMHDSKGAVLNLGRTKRLASMTQILALIARDRGCAFPGCDAPPEWCERHHIIEWLSGGETDVNNLVLLCRYHHRRHLKQGWHIQVRDGVPWFIPPPEIDPTRTPLRNIRTLGDALIDEGRGAGLLVPC